MHFHHIPYLAISDDSITSCIGGAIRRFKYDEFERLDRDWARERYFVVESSMWVSDEQLWKGEMPSDRADLARLALSAHLGVPLPSPSLSVSYSLGASGSVSRRIGCFHRTLLLSDHNVIRANGADVAGAARLADKWFAAGFSSRHPIFSALDATCGSYTALFKRPELMAMPPMIALEAIFAPERAPRIAQRMSTALTRLLGEQIALDHEIKKLYDVRSDIIHGRDISHDVETTNAKAISLVRLATLALLDACIERSIDPNNWRAALLQETT